MSLQHQVKRTLAILHDVVAVAACWALSYWLRFNLELPSNFMHSMMRALPLVLAVHAGVFWIGGLYKGIWRYASLMDLRRIIASVGISSMVVAAAVFMLAMPEIPRSVLLLHPMLLVLMMGGGRFAYRAWRDRLLYGKVLLEGEPVLLIGSGDAAERLIRELNHSQIWTIVGIFTSDYARHGSELRGVRIIGGLNDIGHRAGELGVSRAIVALPESSTAERRAAIEQAVQAGLSVMTVPSLEDILSGKVAVSQMRQVQLEDLLGREPVVLDDSGLRTWLGEHVVLITGAGGSIGSELVRQIAVFKPKQIVLFELSELALYQISEELSRSFPDQPLALAIGDVKDRPRLREVFARYGPSVVFHAAAFKHVPLMEHENAWQAIRNNVFGSRCVAEAAQEFGVEKFVQISTDKAVNPTNVMGASKRLAERLLESMQREEGTRFIIVRFGNVLGSNGSVIPKFREQIARGGPVTVTHPDIVRYFMLIPEAAQLVLQAGLMGEGGEVFVLEMGQPIRIFDLAKDMIRLSGYSESEIPIEFTGLRPGEKLYEELLTDHEVTLPTQHPKLRVARVEECPSSAWIQAVNAWILNDTVGPKDLKDALQGFVPEYIPQNSLPN